MVDDRCPETPSLPALGEEAASHIPCGRLAPVSEISENFHIFHLSRSLSFRPALDELSMQIAQTL